MAPDTFERSRDAFLGKFPSLGGVVADDRVDAMLVRDAAGVVDVSTPAGSMYGGDVDAFVARQMDEFFRNPQRMSVNLPEAESLHSDLSRDMVSFLDAETRRLGGTVLADVPDDRVGYLVVVGLGLGRHLRPLLERVPARHVIVVEPITDFIRLSFHAIDWAALFADLDASGRRLNIVCGGTAAACLDEISGDVERTGIPFFDGSYVYPHYQSAELRELSGLLWEKTPLNKLAMGYFEDEAKMIRNSMRNFAAGGFRFVGGQDPKPRAEPAFVVGSGPSVEDAIDTIKAWQDHAVVFSSGSALQILLHNGITPDYHTELENETVIPKKIEHIASRFPEATDDGVFRDVAIMASSTVSHDAVRRFRQRFLFLRDSASSTRVLRGAHPFISGVGPLVANTSLTMACRMGFREVYLFGVDCGVNDPEKTHGANTIYADPAFKDNVFSDFPLAVPGNFGGTVRTNALYNWSRSMLEQIVRIFGVRAFNCGSGARIAGTTPRAAASVAFDTPPADKAAIHRDLAEQCQAYGPWAFLDGVDLPGLAGEWDDLRRDLLETLDAYRRDGGRDLEALYQSLTRFMVLGAEKYGRMTALVSGSTYGMAQLGILYLTRLDRPDAYDALHDAFVDEFARLLGRMCDDGKALIAEQIADAV